MKFRWITMAAAAWSQAWLVAADPALARASNKVGRHCVDRRDGILFWADFSSTRRRSRTAARRRSMTTADYVGQDPDPNIRLQLHARSADRLFARTVLTG